MTRALLLLLLAIPFLLLAGCPRPEDDPGRTFQLFLLQVQEGKTDAAWALLSTETQTGLAEVVRQRSEASGGAIPNDPKKVLFGSAELAKPVEKVEVARQEGDRATLNVTHVGGGTQEITMVREPAGWRLAIALPPGLGGAP